MSFLTKLYSIKCKRGASDACMSDVLDLLADAFYNVEAQIPPSFYEAKKQVAKMGLSYIKIDVCRFDCMLFWGKDTSMDKCKRCGWDLYKVEGYRGRKRKRRAVKSMRYFSFGPRLQRLFMSPKMAEQMRWHATDAIVDDKMRHPRDGDVWKAFDLDFLVLQMTPGMSG